MNRRAFTRTLGLGALAAGLAPSVRAQDRVINKKLVVVGDNGVGKSCLLITYATGTFPGEYVPGVFDNYSINVTAHGRQLNVGLWDTAGQDDYDVLRPMTYPQTDLFLICFDVASRGSFEHVASKWVPELAAFDRRVPFLVVGCKLDLRESGQAVVGTNEALLLAEKVGAAGYHECSARTPAGLPYLFGSAHRIMLLV